MADAWTFLAAGIASLGVVPHPEFERRARAYLAELQRWNRVSRLTGYRVEAEQVIHLLLESLLLLPVLPSPAAPLLDIGSGAGVPGLVLKLARPEWAVTLVEANRRRANFLRHVGRQLGLQGIHVEEARAEMLGGQSRLRGAFRTVTMRAVVTPGMACGLARPFLDPQGRLVMALGPRAMAPTGAVREVAVAEPTAGLRLRRRFLIIPANELAVDVPRGTRGVRGPRPERGEPEGRGREDDDGRQSRRVARRR